MKIKREKSQEIKERPQPFPTMKLNNFTVSLRDTRKQVLYPISNAKEAEAKKFVKGNWTFVAKLDPALRMIVTS